MGHLVRTALVAGFALVLVSTFLGPTGRALAATPIDVCGALSALSPASASTPARIVIDATTYNLLGQGTITPPDISSRVGNLTHPLVRLTGTANGLDVSNFAVTQVESCGLPNTATNEETALEVSASSGNADSSGNAMLGIGLMAAGSIAVLSAIAMTLLARRGRTH